MNHLAMVLCAATMATVVDSTVFMPTPAEAAKTPSVEALAKKIADGL